MSAAATIGDYVQVKTVPLRTTANQRKHLATGHGAKSNACQQEIALITAYLAGELSRHRTRQFALHVAACPDCAAFLATYQKTVELMRSLLHRKRVKNAPLDLQAANKKQKKKRH